MPEPMAFCEGCGDTVPEAEAYVDQYPGATLMWCEGCADR